MLSNMEEPKQIPDSQKVIRYRGKQTTWELAMHRIVKANIDKFKKLLETESDPTKRAMVICLLAEEETKQKHNCQAGQGTLSFFV